ncbi:UPF0739 protein C1orf74 homolog [Rhineura floridana]|uniref:UPF0739 protein C1orf74 homolog n=1 Tax=Rhineura floridana TaxID=261503 RepID=UPI002AC7F597|nr:UPF0739 protein C1orf74 homolog [Rhineura floridana]XP_061488030.1 UPF0739 protein C1orf74 homolog [Rhineura floridana]
MAEPFPRLLIAAARHHLRIGKKKVLSRSASLNLAGEILAVAAGLKPAFLYDYNSAGTSQILSYVQQLQAINLLGCRLHILSIAESVLIVNLGKMLLWLETILLKDNVPFIDVSASRTCPSLCDSEDVGLIKDHLSEILNHIKAQTSDTSRTLSSSVVFSVKWNLCTLFGVLLGYPAAYSFPAQKSFDNCLSLTPLRVFTVQATFCKISSDFKVQFYSFSIPELLYPIMKIGLDAWCENLKDAFKAQKDFADLYITNEVVALAAVAL